MSFAHVHTHVPVCVFTSCVYHMFAVISRCQMQKVSARVTVSYRRGGGDARGVDATALGVFDSAVVGVAKAVGAVVQSDAAAKEAHTAQVKKTWTSPNENLMYI